YILTVHLPDVMQGSVTDGDPADEHRLQPCDRCDGARSSDLELAIADDGHFFLGRELVGDRPARRTGHEAELPLVVEPVYLVDDPVDVIAQAGAARTDLPVIG